MIKINNSFKHCFCFISLLGLIFNNLIAQGLEEIIVEEYYKATLNDIKSNPSLIDYITYRIFVDMKPGYKLQIVYGNKNHILKIGTTKQFFNNKEKGKRIAYGIAGDQLNDGYLWLDTWITFNAASSKHSGVLKSEDNDGSLIVNEEMKTKDGLITKVSNKMAYYNLNLDAFHEDSLSIFTTQNGGWYVLGGESGPTPENRVLIAQLTTNGELFFELNLQIGTEDGRVERYFARKNDDGEIEFAGLTKNINN